MLFVRLFDLCLFGFIGFLFLLVSGKDCGFCDCGIQWTFLLPLFGDGPVVCLTLCCFVAYSRRRFVLCLTTCYFVLVF